MTVRFENIDKLCGVRGCQQPSCGGWVEAVCDLPELGGRRPVRVEVCWEHLVAMPDRVPAEFQPS